MNKYNFKNFDYDIIRETEDFVLLINPEYVGYDLFLTRPVSAEYGNEEAYTVIYKEHNTVEASTSSFVHALNILNHAQYFLDSDKMGNAKAPTLGSVPPVNTALTVLN